VVALVVVEVVVLLREVGLEEAEPAAAVVVADGQAHAALLRAVLAHRHPHGERGLLEGAVLLVDVEEAGRGVVGHVQVRPAVLVGVEPGDPEAEVPARVGHPRRLAHLREVAVAVVAVEEVGHAGQAAGAALHLDAAMLAGLALAELGQVVEVELHVTADEEVQVAVPVVVGEAATGRPPAAADAGPLGDVGEGAVVVVAIEVIPADGGDVEVLPPVAVHVGRAHSHPPPRVPHARLVRDVLELPVAQVAIERAARRLRILGRVHGQGVHEVDVDEPVVVEIEERDPAAHGLDDVLLLRGRVVLEGDPRLAPDVAEEQLHRAVGRRRRGRGGERGQEDAQDAFHRCIPPPSETPVAVRSRCTCSSISRSFRW
jgi:hypothetical protein